MFIMNHLWITRIERRHENGSQLNFHIAKHFLEMIDTYTTTLLHDKRCPILLQLSRDNCLIRDITRRQIRK